MRIPIECEKGILLELLEVASKIDVYLRFVRMPLQETGLTKKIFSGFLYELWIKCVKPVHKSFL